MLVQHVLGYQIAHPALTTTSNTHSRREQKTMARVSFLIPWTFSSSSAWAKWANSCCQLHPRPIPTSSRVLCILGCRSDWDLPLRCLRMSLSSPSTSPRRLLNSILLRIELAPARELPFLPSLVEFPAISIRLEWNMPSENSSWVSAPREYPPNSP